MKTIFVVRVSLALMLLALAGVDASATLKLHMTQYSNPSGKLWDKTVCDYFSSCDHYFKMSLDLGTSNDNAGGSYYWTQTSGYFQDQNTNNFGGDISGIRNPIVQQFSPSWPGSIKFKVVVKDADDLNKDDHVDDLVSLIQATPAGSESSASWKSLVMIGQRPADKTSMTMEYLLFCDPNYFSSDCSVFCVAKDSDDEGHYTCDPATGSKVCRYGWEDTSNSCKTRSDDCIGNNCQNGATCVDGVRSYTCTCPPGYAGTDCSTNINECASSPCVNGGTCTDLINGFRCACPPAFVGPTCSLPACAVMTNPCSNGGTCYGAGQCRCPPGFIGDDCSISRCDVLSCRNGATCANGTCICPQGVTGGMCDTVVCDLKTCQNGGSCHIGQCTCQPGFTGALCEVNIDDCVDDPCDNDGTCDDVINGFVCRCLPDYAGPRCSDVVSNGDAANLTHNMEMTYTKYGEDSGMDGTKRWFIASFPVIFILLIIIILVVCLIRRRKHSDIVELDTSRTCLEASDLDKKSLDSFAVNTTYAVSNDYNEVKATSSGSKISLYDVERKVQNDYEKPEDAAGPAERNVYEKIVDMSPTPRLPSRTNPLARTDSNTSC